MKSVVGCQEVLLLHMSEILVKIAKNCDIYHASHGQGLPKLCPRVDKWWLFGFGQAREEAPNFLHEYKQYL